MSRHIKVNDHFLVPGTDERPARLVNPGSVVALEDDMAKDFVKRGKGTFHAGPVFDAPPPPEDEKPERADLGNKLARAERAVATAGAR